MVQQIATQQNKEIRVGIVADDLSGAMDAGLQFSKRGAQAVVALRNADYSDVEVLIISTESRDTSPTEAAKLMESAALLLRGRKVYKKIDSTLRGNVGAEIKALMKALKCERAIITPAFPEQGRVVLEGELLIKGRPWHKTAFAKSPFSQGWTSRVDEILAQQTGSICSYVELFKVERGPWGLVRALESQAAALVVVDAVTREHLDILAKAILLSEGRWLPCGSAGLAQSWAEALIPDRKTSWPRPESNEPILLIAGSRQRTTATQIRRAARRLHLPVVSFAASGGRQNPEQVAARVAEHLAKGQSVALTSIAGDPFIPEREMHIPEALGQVVAEVCAAQKVGGLILTGGSIALGVCEALDVMAIQITDEIEPGVPAGILQGGPLSGTSVITKAGGFGSPEVLIKAVNYLRGQANGKSRKGRAN